MSAPRRRWRRRRLPGAPSRLDSIMSVSAATVDEHFEANPVMELAEIMLSFGRVKGAAQALQEYIDSNPQEALKPWIRLMEIYRMAGLRKEFEKVARDLNRNFNVEVQRWEQTVEPESAGPVDVILDTEPVAAGNQLAGGKVEGIEGMPAITEQVVLRWNDGNVIDYMNQLLRDNRGGTRLGFSLPVISDILFLVELKEVSNKIEKETTAS
jgi:pilus assembly protein FimV